MADNNVDGIKRYTPPVHRNRTNNRRKPGVYSIWLDSRLYDIYLQLIRADKPNYAYSNDGEKSHVPSVKNLPPIVPREAFFSNVQNDYSQTRLVPLDGCSASEASHLLSDRWAAAMNLYNDQSIDSSEKPVLYSGSAGSSWSHLKLPHQMNFLEELSRAMDAQRESASPIDAWN